MELIKHLIRADAYGFPNGSTTARQVEEARGLAKPPVHGLFIITTILNVIMCVIAASVITACSTANTEAFQPAEMSPGAEQLLLNQYMSTIDMLSEELAIKESALTEALETISKSESADKLTKVPPTSVIESVPLSGSTNGSQKDELTKPTPVSANADAIIGTQTTPDGSTLVEYALPSAFYGSDLDFSSFQGFMDYRTVTLEGTGSYRICHSPDSYTDRNGLRRYKTTSDMYTVDGQDDYVIALGTFYKEKNTIGSRYLIVTSTGRYTAITGDEKGDAATDPLHMFGMCGDNPNVIEFIVDTDKLNADIALHGTVTKGPVEAFEGEILNIFKIE